MPWIDDARWYDSRLARNLKGVHYRCPLCGQLLPSLSDHMLLFPEGDRSRRRHAHTECAVRARRAGLLPTRDEWRRSLATEFGDDRAGKHGWLARLRRLLSNR